MILIFIAAFLVGTLVSSAAHYLYYTNKIDKMQMDARKAISDQARESFGSGYMRCYAEEVVRRNKNGDQDQTIVMTAIS